MISASALQRLHACPASVKIRELMTPSQRALSALASQPMGYTVVGNKFHDEVARAIQSGRIPDELRKYIPTGATAEVAYVLDLRDMSVHNLGYGIDRQYRQRVAALDIPEDSAVPGTCDVVGVDDQGRAVVIDWKTGLEVEAPEFNKQLLIYAFFATRDLGTDSAVIKIVYKRDDDAEPWSREFEIDAMTLMAFADAQRQLPAAIENAKPNDATQGAHCRHCEAKPGCKHFALAATAAKFAALRDPETELIIPDHERVHAVEMLDMLSPFVKKLQSALRGNCASQGDIAMPDGRVYGLRTKRGNEVIDADVAFPLLERAHGLVTALAATKKEITKTSLKNALALAKDDGTTLAAAEREALAMLRDAGAISNRADSEQLGFVTEPKKLKEVTK